MPHYTLTLTGRMTLVVGAGLLFAGFILGRKVTDTWSNTRASIKQLRATWQRRAS